MGPDAVEQRWLTRISSAVRRAVARFLGRTETSVSTSRAEAEELGYVFLDETLLPTAEDFERVLFGDLQPDLTDVFTTAYRQTHPAAPEGSAPVLTEAQQRQIYMSGVHDRLSRTLWPTDTLDSIRAELQQALDQGLTLDETRDLIRPLLRPDAYDWWVERVARTELHAAYNAGTYGAALDAQQASGQLTYLVWHAEVHDGRTRLAHRAADGQATPVGQPFVVGGETLRFPGDPYGSPGNTVNCRCHLSVTTRPAVAAAARSQEDPMPVKRPCSCSSSALTADTGPTDDDEEREEEEGGVLPVAPADTPFDPKEAGTRMLAAATDADGTVDYEQLATGYLYTAEPGPDGPAPGDMRLPVADVIDNTLTLVPQAVQEASDALAAKDHAGVPEEQLEDVLDALYEARQASGLDVEEDELEEVDEEALTAAATTTTVPAAAPAVWFADPQLSGPTRPTVTADGRVFGHIATWRDEDGHPTCHQGSPPGECITVPHSPSGYQHFHVGSYLTAEGQELSVGTLTAGTGHASTSPYVSAAQATAHYDNTGYAAAAVRMGEDVHGIWFAGALVEGVTAEQIATLRRSPQSGDWRTIGGHLELVASLAVNNPGFGIPRARQSVGADGRVAAVTAAGLLLPARRCPSPAARVEVTAHPEVVATIAAATVQAYVQHQEREQRAGRRRAHVASLAASVRQVRAVRLAERARSPRAQRSSGPPVPGDEGPGGVSSQLGRNGEPGVVTAAGRRRNWVEKTGTGHLPKYIRKIADTLIRDHAFTESRAIATAVNRTKRWCRGGGNVKADTRAKACAALAEWEAKRAQAKIT